MWGTSTWWASCGAPRISSRWWKTAADTVTCCASETPSSTGTSRGSRRASCKWCRAPLANPNRCRSPCKPKRVTRMRLETSFLRTGRAGGRIAALLAGLLLAAAPAFAATVKSVSMKEAGSATQVIIEADGPINFHDFTLESPDRIIVDCPGSTLAFTERTWSGRDGTSGKNVRASEMGWGKEAGARIVVDLTRPASYALSSVGNNLVLAVETQQPSSKDAATPAPAPEPHSADRGDGR